MAAAVEAARSGKSVLVLEPTQLLGGLTSSGLGATDVGNKDAIGGIAREFYRAVKEWYEQDDAWIWQRRDEFRGRGHRESQDAAWTFEPKVAAAIFERWAAHEGIEVLRGVRLDRSRIEFAPTWGNPSRIAAVF
ncbi:MAG: FAD-dependent oxidoreductase, partial [Planctomycetes bacterium]|nr:FAD-dependent oxidoreductase [Planctomycetota bacterium]